DPNSGRPANADFKGLQQGADGTPAGPNGLLFNENDFKGGDSDPTLPQSFADAADQTKTGLKGLGDVDEVSILCCPDEFYLPNNVIASDLKSQCESLKDRFAILQAAAAAITPEKNNPSVNSKYAAYYYPWLRITNPTTSVPLLIPPGGHIAGIYARSD